MSESPHHWHHDSVQGTFDTVDSSPDGLTLLDAVQRLDLHGPNKLPDSATRSPLM
ncbi:hypothetical protein C9J12_29770, partial [Photobacterium frigidiphilum]